MIESESVLLNKGEGVRVPDLYISDSIIIKKNKHVSNLNIYKNYYLKFTLNLDDKMLTTRDFQRSILQIGWSIQDTIFGFNLKEGTNSSIKIKNSLDKLHEVVIDVLLPFGSDIEFEYIS